MNFYLQLLDEQYSFLESQHQLLLAQSTEQEQETQTCPCGMVWLDECRGCEEGALYQQDQEKAKILITQSISV